eukprot:Em0009g617a
MSATSSANTFVFSTSSITGVSSTTTQLSSTATPLFSVTPTSVTVSTSSSSLFRFLTTSTIIPSSQPSSPPFISTPIASTISTTATTVTTGTRANAVGPIAGGVLGSVGGVLLLLLVAMLIILFFCRVQKSKVPVHKEAIVDMYESSAQLEGYNKRNGDQNGEVSIHALGVPSISYEERCRLISMEEFPSHVKDLHHNANRKFEEEFSSVPAIPLGPYEVSKLPYNLPKNRFENIFPYDTSRVILAAIPGKEGSDYMNASYIDGYNKPDGYIAAQGPLSETVCDFWRMVWEKRLPTIVMLTELMEGGRSKCERYWPENINDNWDVGCNLRVCLIEQRPFAEYTVKILIVTNTSDSDAPSLRVTHYHFTVWPDHGVPADKTCMIQFIKRVRNTHPYKGPPLLVHCSAGVGRTGTFIVLDSMLERMKCERSLNVYEFVCEMRKKRILMVQTEMQYIFVHDALEEYITCGDTSVLVANMKITISRLGKGGFVDQFKLLDEVSYKPNAQSCNEGQAEHNQGKNRYPDKLPLNMTRIRLRPTGVKGADYINATFVDGYKARKACIATQGPLQSTVGDFWRMIWENQSRVIVMLCDPSEDGKESCYYWPREVGKHEVHGRLKVKLVSEDTAPKDYIIRKIELTADSNYLIPGVPDTVTVTQFHCTTWPENGKPTASCILKIIDVLVKAQISSGNRSITVMCNDGIGRTGAFIGIYAQLERIKTEGIADIFQYIKGARLQCPGLVSSVEQYIFCHEVIADYVGTFDNYANFKE